MYKRYQADVVIVENNAYQQSVLDALNDDQMAAAVGAEKVRLPVIPFTTGKQKADREIGLPGLAAKLEQGLWRFPVGDEWPHPGECECAVCRLASELTSYPIGEHDDMVMALWFAERAVDRTGAKWSYTSVRQGSGSSPRDVLTQLKRQYKQSVRRPDVEEGEEDVPTDQRGRPMPEHLRRRSRGLW